MYLPHKFNYTDKCANWHEIVFLFYTSYIQFLVSLFFFIRGVLINCECIITLMVTISSTLMVTISSPLCGQCLYVRGRIHNGDMKKKQIVWNLISNSYIKDCSSCHFSLQTARGLCQFVERLTLKGHTPMIRLLWFNSRRCINSIKEI